MKAKKRVVAGILLMAAAIFLFDTIPTQAQYYPGRKSAETAGALSFFSTAAPIGAAIWLGNMDGVHDDVPPWMAVGGLILGPSAGYYYAGMTKRGLIGIGIRTTLLVGTAVAVELAEKENCGWEGCRNESVPTIVLIGTGTLLVATMADIILVQEYVKKRNRAFREGSWMVTPVYFAGQDAGGLQLQITF